MDFKNIQSLRYYFLRLDSHQQRDLFENKPIDVKSKPPYTYSSSFIRKVSLKVSLKVKNASYHLFSRQAIEVAHKQKVTHV